MSSDKSTDSAEPGSPDGAVFDDHEAGATSPGLEIAQMRHAWQRARMFMS